MNRVAYVALFIRVAKFVYVLTDVAQQGSPKTKLRWRKVTKAQAFAFNSALDGRVKMSRDAHGLRLEAAL